jgi:hypothetical protein
MRPHSLGLLCVLCAVGLPARAFAEPLALVDVASRLGFRAALSLPGERAALLGLTLVPVYARPFEEAWLSHLRLRGASTSSRVRVELDLNAGFLGLRDERGVQRCIPLLSGAFTQGATPALPTFAARSLRWDPDLSDVRTCVDGGASLHLARGLRADLGAQLGDLLGGSNLSLFTGISFRR